LVVVGGSYPGALVAWFKSKYPQHAVAAWSSSGVIHAIRDYNMFDTDILETTLTSGNSCTHKIQELTNMIDHIFLKGTKEEKLSMFEKLGNPYPETHMGDFMYYVADMFAGPV